MWIFKNDAFVSIVEDRDMPDQLWVRARVRGDLERFFGVMGRIIEVVETPSADYRFRCAVDRQMVKVALSDAVADIDYTNFKNSIGTAPVEEERHSAYLRVWTAMMAFQRWALSYEASPPKRQMNEQLLQKKSKKKGAQS